MIGGLADLGMEAAMLLRPLLPDHRLLALEEVRIVGDSITILVSSTSSSNQCPQCCQSSERVHSHTSERWPICRAGLGGTCSMA